MSLQSSGFSLVKYDTPILVSKTFSKKRFSTQKQSSPFRNISHVKLKAHEKMKKVGDGRINKTYKEETPHLSSPAIRDLISKYPIKT